MKNTATADSGRTYYTTSTQPLLCGCREPFLGNAIPNRRAAEGARAGHARPEKRTSAFDLCRRRHRLYCRSIFRDSEFSDSTKTIAQTNGWRLTAALVAAATAALRSSQSRRRDSRRLLRPNYYSLSEALAAALDGILYILCGICIQEMGTSRAH